MSNSDALFASPLVLASCEFHKLIFCGFTPSCYWVFQIIFSYSFTSTDGINVKTALYLLIPLYIRPLSSLPRACISFWPHCHFSCFY